MSVRSYHTITENGANLHGLTVRGVNNAEVGERRRLVVAGRQHHRIVVQHVRAERSPTAAGIAALCRGTGDHSRPTNRKANICTSRLISSGRLVLNPVVLYLSRLG